MVKNANKDLTLKMDRFITVLLEFMNSATESTQFCTVSLVFDVYPHYNCDLLGSSFASS